MTTLVLIGIVQRDELGDAERLEVIRTHVMDECKELGELLEVSKPKEHHRTKRNRALKHERSTQNTTRQGFLSNEHTWPCVRIYLYITADSLKVRVPAAGAEGAGCAFADFKEREDALARLLREELALDFGVRQMQLPASAALAHTILSLTT